METMWELKGKRVEGGKKASVEYVEGAEEGSMVLYYFEKYGSNRF